MIIHVGALARPYIFFERWPAISHSGSAVSARCMFVDSWQPGEAPEAALAELRNQKPNLLIVSGEAPEALTDKVPTDRYPVRISTSASDEGRIHILAEDGVVLEPLQELGVGAMPGGLVKVRIDSHSLELGVLALQPSFSKDAFERNRISARRLASLMRASDATRVVVGSFNATPFSQFVSVYLQQARMRSVFFGQGLAKTFDMTSSVIAFPLTHALVSKDLRPEDIERLTLPGRRRAAIAFTIRM